MTRQARRIWKFPLVLPEQVVLMPEGATIMHVGQQEGIPTLWVIVVPDRVRQQRLFRVIPTGAEIRPDAAYVGTCQIGDGLVWHVLEVA